MNVTGNLWWVCRWKENYLFNKRTKHRNDHKGRDTEIIRVHGFSCWPFIVCRWVKMNRGFLVWEDRRSSVENWLNQSFDVRYPWHDWLRRKSSTTGATKNTDTIEMFFLPIRLGTCCWWRFCDWTGVSGELALDRAFLAPSTTTALSHPDFHSVFVHYRHPVVLLLVVEKSWREGRKRERRIVSLNELFGDKDQMEFKEHFNQLQAWHDTFLFTDHCALSASHRSIDKILRGNRILVVKNDPMNGFVRIDWIITVLNPDQSVHCIVTSLN